MRKYFALFSSLLIVTLMTAAWITVSDPADPASKGASGVGDPYFPELGNGGYDAGHFTINLDVNLKTKTIAGTVTMYATTTQELSQFDLDFAGFTIHSLTVNGTDATYKREDRELIITPAQVLPNGSNFRVDVTYSGIPGQNKLTRQPFSGGWQSYSGGVYVASQPDGASLWYPTNDHPQDKATYTFLITVDKPYIVAANGQLQRVEEKPNDRWTYVWEARDPTASYLVTVNIAQFTRQEEEGGDIIVRNYFPQNKAVQGTRTFSHTSDMISYFSTIFGQYPFEAYGVVVADTPLPFALETQTLSLFGSNALTDSLNTQVVIAHELAHQWFGDSVSVDTWRDIWLNEGFATYASALWVEHEYGKAEFDRLMDNWYKMISNPAFVQTAALVGDPTAARMFHASVYFRGAWTLHALRLKVGDDTFFRILQTYYAQHEYGNAKIDDFIATAEAVSGQNLRDFFNGWLYQREIPK